MTNGIITLQKDREKPVRNQHPWIFSGAIAKAQHAINGDIVTVVNAKGEFLARGYYNNQSQIQVRLLTWQNEPIDETWWRATIRRAIQARLPLLAHTNALRLIHSESDYLPGLVADVYGQFLVLQIGTLGIDIRKQALAQYIVEEYNALVPSSQHLVGVHERGDSDMRSKEGLRGSQGTLWGEACPDRITIQENGVLFTVDLAEGHKTGFYIDQRDNRNIARHWLESHSSPRVLNLFSYTGGFGASILAGNPNAYIINVDSSSDALTIAEEAFALNGFPLENSAFVTADAFSYLRDSLQDGEQFDMIVCDPPKFANNASQVEKATRGYKDLNLQSFKLIKPGGLLLTFSCSGSISPDLFQKVVFGALADSGRQAQILQFLGAGYDHPIALTFPEGQYLKGLLLRVY